MQFSRSTAQHSKLRRTAGPYIWHCHYWHPPTGSGSLCRSQTVKQGKRKSNSGMPGLLIDLPRRGVPFLQRSGSLSCQRPAPVELEQFGGKVEQRGPRKGDDPCPLHHANLVTANQ